MKKKTNLESGFLFLYDWMPVLEHLPAKEVKALLLALIARQRENKPLPSFHNPLTNSFARMIEPVIRRRLEGAEWAKKGLAEQEPDRDPPGVPQGNPHHQREEQKKEEKQIIEDFISEEERKKEQPPTGGEASAQLRALSEQEKALLMSEGLPAAYIEERAERALAFEAKSGRGATSLLREWWKSDKKPCFPYRQYRSAQAEPPEHSSFDIDDFFNAALAASYEKSLSKQE
ncbi:MAG: hypothetical protein E7585_04680 [Ruminococcaceae bacterium]|nr:hypothetical protein [Oscillospiraceae bacterium]